MESIETTTSLEPSDKSYRISTATEHDLELLAEMGYLFADLYGKSLMKFRASVFVRKMREFMQAGQGTVLCLHENKWDLRGAIAGVLYENVFDGELCATELFWYVWPGAQRGAGTALLQAFEEWALQRKATRVTMAYMHHNMPERLADFYTRRGYSVFETHYVKTL
jgi:GNAT superfamily N-acetyltransferase